MSRGKRFESARRLSFSCDLQGNVEQKECSPKSRKKLHEQYSGLGQLTLSMEYDAVVMQPQICIGRWDRSPPLSLT
jgi:hypothetical protein